MYVDKYIDLPIVISILNVMFILSLQLYIILFKNIFIYLLLFWLCWVFVAALRLSQVVASRGYSLL